MTAVLGTILRLGVFAVLSVGGLACHTSRFWGRISRTVAAFYHSTEIARYRKLPYDLSGKSE